MEMTWADKIEARGREAGLLTGAREIITGQLKERFGQLPPGLEKRLLQVEDMSRLQALAAQLLRAESLDELDLLPGS